MRTAGEGTLVSFEPRDRDTFEVRLDGPVPAGIVEGDALENLTWSPDVTIRDNAFESNRARGVLVSTPGRVLIERNRFESSGSAILIAGRRELLVRVGRGPGRDDPGQRLRAGLPRARRTSSARASSASSPRSRAPDPAFPFHRNIRIEDNEFHPSDYPVLYAKSVDGLSLRRQPADPQPAPRARSRPEGDADVRGLPPGPCRGQPLRGRRPGPEHRPRRHGRGRALRRPGAGLGSLADRNPLDFPPPVLVDSTVPAKSMRSNWVPSGPLAGGAVPGQRARHRAHDVRLLVPGHDGVQRRQADHPLEVHLQPRRRQPPLRPAGGGPADRRPDAGLQRARGAPAAPLRGSPDPGRDGRAARRLLVPVRDRGRLGLGGVLPDGAHPRPPADQPVLDAGQRHLRRATGQARLRVHRRRVEPRRHDGGRPDRSRREPRRDGEPALVQRGRPPGLLGARRAGS